MNRKSNGRKNKLHPNIWVLSAASFFTDISSEMILNTLPLFLSNVLGVKTNIIGLIEGVAESFSSVLKLFSGWISDKLKIRKWITVTGYAISTLMKPVFYFASSWGTVAGGRWADRVGKGIRTAPRDALVADSVTPQQRGMAFGLHRAADTAGAFIGLLVAFAIIYLFQESSAELKETTFRTIVLVSLIPAILAVLILIFFLKDIKKRRESASGLPGIRFRSLGKRFMHFIIIIGIFELGNSSDAFLILKAQQTGVSVSGIFIMLILFNLTYSLVSAPAGKWSDRWGRRKLIMVGWVSYAMVYSGFAMVQSALGVGTLYVLYGMYYGLTYGTAKAIVADIVSPDVRGFAYGTYNAVLGIFTLPASAIAGLLWSGLGSWQGFGPRAPFIFGAIMAIIAVILFILWSRKD